MPKGTSLRFAIADSVPRSEVWSFFTSGDDVYLTGSAYKNVLKISLHKSGICQIAMLGSFFAEHVKAKEGAPEYRDILRWERLPTPTGMGRVAVSILFASCEFWTEADQFPASKSYVKLVPPKDMHCRIVDVAYSGDDPRPIAIRENWADDLLFALQLPCGDFVSVITYIESLPSDFFSFAPIEDRRGILTLGIEEEERDDARGISVFDCAQVYEGHGCVCSLHNMRAMSIDAYEAGGLK